MLTKGAIGNLINRYRAVLKKCNLINTFGSLAVASMLVLGGAGMAMADDVALNGNNNATGNYTDKTNLIGGWLMTGSSTADQNKDVTTSIDSKKVSEIIGGSYAKGKSGTASTTVEHKNISLTIDTAETTTASSAVEFVVGGSKLANDANVALKNADITLTINNGTFGNNNTDGYELVTGGNYIKTNSDTGANTATAENISVAIKKGTFNATVVGGSTAHAYTGTTKADTKTTVTDASTSVTIESGTFNPSKTNRTKSGSINLEAAVIGGGLAYVEKADVTGTVTSTVTGSSSVALKGGTFNGKIVAGGYAMNGSTANVGSTNLEMTGGTVNADIIGGGLVDGKKDSPATTANVTGSTSVTVSGGFLKDAEIIGGGYVRNGNGTANVGGDTHVTVEKYSETQSSQKWVQYVIGGGKAMTNYSDDVANAGVAGSTNVAIGEKNGQINIEFGNVAGGGLARVQQNGGNATATVEKDSNVTIYSGTLAGVAGGGVAEALAKAQNKATANVGGTANLTINGGTINTIEYKGNDNTTNTVLAAVVGGGIAYVSADAPNGSAEAKVGTVNLTINGGTINGDVYAGGMADGEGASADVTTATLNLNGGTIKGDVYASQGYVVDKTTNASAAVSNATLNINGDVAIEGSLNADNATLNYESGNVSATETGSVSGTTITVGAAANDALHGNPEALAKALNADLSKAGSVVMEEGLVAGAVTRNADGKTYTKKANSILRDKLELSTGTQLAVNRTIMNDVRKRMGDLRTSPEDAGVWVRWNGGKLKGDSGLTNNFNTIQVGADMLTGIKNVRAGVAAAFTHGDVDHNNGDGEMEAYTFSAYGTWMAENGMFADVIAHAGFSNSDLSVKGNKLDLDNEIFTLSGEYGWRLPICEQFFVEPQVELTYTYITSADSRIDYATYEIDSMDSLIGRAGMLFGWNLPDDRGNVYARASVVHEFLGDSKISGSAFGNTEVYELNGDDTWFEYGIGANVKLTDNTYIWADVERTEGAKIDEEWRGTVGFRFSF